MKTNISVWDRILRVVIGAALVGASIGGYIGIWGWIGIVPLLTGAVGYCPMYKLHRAILGKGS
ncbi:MAG: DUF2892 domain-containing protein [Alphaproteobacteria bacterium]|nr:DUF2892 domain-containing protein [Alphaproteobacteria bacterium]